MKGKQGYSTTNAGYGVHFPSERNAMDLKKREATPWGTSNAAYGKGISIAHSDYKSSPVQGSIGSIASFRSQPLYLSSVSGQNHLSPTQSNGILSPAQKREALEERLEQVDKSYGNSGFKLPTLDTSKYLVAQGPPTGYKQMSIGSKRDPKIPSDPQSISAPKAETGPPPKTGLARKYMRDTLDRFLNAIPENLRPKTRKTVKPREGPQVLKIKSARKRKSPLPHHKSESAFSHAVPSSSSSPSMSSRSSSPGEELIDLNDSLYDLSKEVEK